MTKIEDYKERFDFYCIAHGIVEALTWIGQSRTQQEGFNSGTNIGKAQAMKAASREAHAFQQSEIEDKMDPMVQEDQIK